MTAPRLHNGRRITLAEAHRLRVEARQHAGGGPVVSDAQQLMAAALWAHRRELKQVKSTAEKVRRKRGMLPDYWPYVEGVLLGDKGGPDDVLLTIMVWAFDTQQFDRALAIAEYAMRHQLTVPDRFARDTPAIIAEQTAEEVLLIIERTGRLKDLEVEADAPEPPPPAELVEVCARAARIVEGADIHDAIRAKLLKARGYAERAAGLPEAALRSLRAALAAYPRVGVKKDADRLEALIRRAADAARA